MNKPPIVEIKRFFLKKSLNISKGQVSKTKNTKYFRGQNTKSKHSDWNINYIYCTNRIYSARFSSPRNAHIFRWGWNTNSDIAWIVLLILPAKIKLNVQIFTRALVFQLSYKGLGETVTYMFPYVLQQTCFQMISPACKFQRFTSKHGAREHF